MRTKHFPTKTRISDFVLKTWGLPVSHTHTL